MRLSGLLASSDIHLDDIEFCHCCFGKHIESWDWHELALFEGESELLELAFCLKLLIIWVWLTQLTFIF